MQCSVPYLKKVISHHSLQLSYCIIKVTNYKGKYFCVNPPHHTHHISLVITKVKI